MSDAVQCLQLNAGSRMSALITIDYQALPGATPHRLVKRGLFKPILSLDLGSVNTSLSIFALKCECPSKLRTPKIADASCTDPRVSHVPCPSRDKPESVALIRPHFLHSALKIQIDLPQLPIIAQAVNRHGRVYQPLSWL